MVLYQLKSLHWNDYNLIYSQNKNRGFDKILKVFPLKTQHFPFTNITQNQSNQQYSSKLNPIQPQNSFTTKTKLLLSTFGIFPNSNTNKRGLGFESYLKSLDSSIPRFLVLDHQISYSHGEITTFSPSTLNRMMPYLSQTKCPNESFVSQRQKCGLKSPCLIRPCLA